MIPQSYIAPANGQPGQSVHLPVDSQSVHLLEDSHPLLMPDQLRWWFSFQMCSLPRQTNWFTLHLYLASLFREQPLNSLSFYLSTVLHPLPTVLHLNNDLLDTILGQLTYIYPDCPLYRTWPQMICLELLQMYLVPHCTQLSGPLPQLGTMHGYPSDTTMRRSWLTTSQISPLCVATTALIRDWQRMYNQPTVYIYNAKFHWKLAS